MSKRNSSEDPTRGGDSQNLMSEQARQQLAMASEVSCVMCRAAEALQQIQQHATQRAALRYQQVADQIRSAHTPAEVMAIQATLMTSGMQEVAQYMQDMTTATLRIQSTLMEARRGQDSAAMAGQSASAAFSAWQNAMTGGSSSPSAHH
jgi:hypothetical protein